MLRLRTNGDRAALPVGTQRSMHTHLAIPAHEFDHNRLVLAHIDRWRPTATRPASRTCPMMSLPIDREIGRRKALGFRRLAPIIAPHRTQKIEVLALFTLDEQFRIDIAHINEMDRRQEVTVLQGLMDLRGHSVIRSRGAGRFDIRNEMGQRGATTLGEMDRVANPGGAALLAGMGITIIR